MLEKSQIVTLTIQLPGAGPVAHVLQDETTTLGRMPGNTVVLKHPSVSLVHAKITRKDGQFYLKDLNSTNGTVVNGQPVKEARLRNRDQIGFADVTALFQMDEPAAALPPVPLAVSAPAAPAPRPAPPVPVPSPRAHAPPRPAASKSSRLASYVAPVLGGIAALTVVSVFAWRFIHLQAEGLEPSSLVAQPGGPAQVVEVAEPPIEVHARESIPKGPAASKGAEPRAKTAEPAPQAFASLEQMLTSLKTGGVAERRKAAGAVHALGGEARAAVPALREALQDPDEEVRMWSALTLINQKCYDKGTIPVLVRTLEHENPMLRQVACLSLAMLPYEPAEKPAVARALLARAMGDADAEVRQAAASALQVIEPEAEPGLTAMPKQ